MVEGRGTGRRATFHHGDLADALVAAASKLIAARAGPDFSLREVAEAVGVSHTAAYRHFAAKVDLVAEIARRGFVALDAAVRAAAEGAGDPRGALFAAGLAYVAFAEAHPGAYRVMFLGGLCDPERHPGSAEAAAVAFATLVATVARAQGAGAARADVGAEELASALWAAEHGHATLLLDGLIRDGGDGPCGAPAAARSVLIETMLAGLAPPGDR